MRQLQHVTVMIIDGGRRLRGGMFAAAIEKVKGVLR